ncbi:hypothetical protein BC831DRAFT_510910 [Entophlyctis helioformis]|nr:hypothetical protein BC831DRAFT_510910 [Entophlyctis helioformis]
MVDTVPPSVFEKRGSAGSLLDYSIIYEVNLSVPKVSAEGYLAYLKAFTLNVVKDVPGFTNAVVYSQPKPEGLHWLSEEGNDKSYYTVHYHVDSQKNLETYLEKYQQQVADADQEKWGFLVTSRRILRMQMSSFDD